jgi:hypothetical protein
VSSNLDGNKTEYFRDLLSWETEGERTPAQPVQRMVRIADTWVTPETAAEFLAEVA